MNVTIKSVASTFITSIPHLLPRRIRPRSSTRSFQSPNHWQKSLPRISQESRTSPVLVNETLRLFDVQSSHFHCKKKTGYLQMDICDANVVPVPVSAFDWLLVAGSSICAILHSLLLFLLLFLLLLFFFFFFFFSLVCFFLQVAARRRIRQKLKA